MKIIEGLLEDEVTVSDSYQPCSCGGDCIYLDNSTEQEPCWGVASVLDSYGDDDNWIHVCNGHTERYYDGPFNKRFDSTKYTPEVHDDTDTTRKLS